MIVKGIEHLRDGGTIVVDCWMHNSLFKGTCQVFINCGSFGGDNTVWLGHWNSDGKKIEDEKILKELKQEVQNYNKSIQQYTDTINNIIL